MGFDRLPPSGILQGPKKKFEGDKAAFVEDIRKALLASRQNAIFSLPMLAFMVGTSHFAYTSATGAAGGRALYWAITVVLWLLFELNALGVFGKDPGGTRKVYDTHKAALITGVIYTVVQLAVFKYVL